MSYQSVHVDRLAVFDLSWSINVEGRSVARSFGIVVIPDPVALGLSVLGSSALMRR